MTRTHRSSRSSSLCASELPHWGARFTVSSPTPSWRSSLQSFATAQLAASMTVKTKCRVVVFAWRLWRSKCTHQGADRNLFMVSSFMVSILLSAAPQMAEHRHSNPSRAPFYRFPHKDGPLMRWWFCCPWRTVQGTPLPDLQCSTHPADDTGRLNDFLRVVGRSFDTDVPNRAVDSV